jgi:hypothetical protein
LGGVIVGASGASRFKAKNGGYSGDLKGDEEKYDDIDSHIQI